MSEDGGGLTDNHTCEQLLCAQKPVLFLWMLLHVSFGPVTLPRTRKSHHHQHLEGGREKDMFTGEIFLYTYISIDILI